MSRQDLSIGRTLRRNGRESMQQNQPAMLALKPGSPQLSAIAPAIQPLTTASFSGGYVTSVAPEQLQDNASPFMVDWEVSRSDKLVRAPGTSLVEVLAHAPTATLVHSNLDASSELLLFAAPFVGVKRFGDTVWTDEGILEGGNWVGANYAGSYIFTNGRETVYSREAGDANIRATTIPVGRTLAAWNGRLWVANAIIGGNFLPMGIIWSSAVGNFEDFTGLGTGFEELIYDFSADDGIVAARPMSLDFMAILCKKSLWVARRTDDVNEPGDFSPVETGVGCVSEKTARLGYGGVLYLSSVGVQLFDGQKSLNISEQINADLLPLDLDNIDQYWGEYDSTKRRYSLGTPTGTWVFDINFNRWYKKTLIADSCINFPQELPLLTWDTEVGTWDDAMDDWADYDPHGQPDRIVFVKDKLLHAEDYGSSSYFNVPFIPKWRSKSIMASRLGEMVNVQGMSLRYNGSGEIRVLTQSAKGKLVELMVRRLPDTDGEALDGVYSGLRTGLRGQMEVQLLSGNIKVDAFGLMVQLSSDVLGRL